MKKILWLAVIVAVAASFMMRGKEQAGAEATAVTKVELGGDFSLIGTDGGAVTNKDFAGKYTLVFFGFTFCPDICPATLTTLTTVLEQLDGSNPEMAAKLAPIFITVDPERDTPEVLREYMSNFDARIAGLTGSKEQVEAAANAYKVYYAARKESPEDSNYLVDHSGYVYLMSPEGKYLTHFTHDKSVDEVIGLLNNKM